MYRLLIFLTLFCSLGTKRWVCSLGLQVACGWASDGLGTFGYGFIGQSVCSVVGMDDHDVGMSGIIGAGFEMDVALQQAGGQLVDVLVVEAAAACGVYGACFQLSVLDLVVSNNGGAGVVQIGYAISKFKYDIWLGVECQPPSTCEFGFIECNGLLGMGWKDVAGGQQEGQDEDNRCVFGVHDVFCLQGIGARVAI